MYLNKNRGKHFKSRRLRKRNKRILTLNCMEMGTLASQWVADGRWFEFLCIEYTYNASSYTKWCLFKIPVQILIAQHLVKFKGASVNKGSKPSYTAFCCHGLEINITPGPEGQNLFVSCRAYQELYGEPIVCNVCLWNLLHVFTQLWHGTRI